MKIFNKLQLLIIIFYCSTVLNAQSNASTLQPDYWYSISKNQMLVYQDPSRTLDLNTVKKKEFQTLSTVPSNFQATYWLRFRLQPLKASDTLVLALFGADKANIYIPSQEGYIKEQVGIMTTSKFAITEKIKKNTLKIPSSTIDFSKPFYISRFAFSVWAKNSLANNTVFYMYQKNDFVFEQWAKTEDSQDKAYSFYLGITVMSLLLFLAGYFVNGSKSFLLYSIYLLTLVIYYTNRLPILLNLWNKIGPEIYYYVNQSQRFATTISYYIFIYYFLNVKTNFKTLHKFFKGIIYAMIGYGIFYLTIIIFFPYFIYRFQVIDYFFLVTTIISIALFVIMLTQKPSKIAVVTLVGSLLITIGGIIAVFKTDAVFLLKAVLWETIIFFAVINYQNRLKEKLALNSLVELNREKQEKESLKQLDELKSRFFENISHEFRTPLTLIKAPVDNAIQKKLAIRDNDLQMIDNNVNRLTVLINDLLSLSKLESKAITLHYTSQNPNKQLQKIVNQYFSYAQSKNIAFKVTLEKKQIIADYDTEILERVTTNLISNAFKFTEENGQINLRLSIKDEHLKLEVEDSGIGITEENQKKIFDRFYQVSEKDESRIGSGIGLAMVKELLHLHKGRISVNSIYGKGSLFCIIIPLINIREDVEYDIFSEKQPKTIASGKSEKLKDTNVNQTVEYQKQLVLIVEDNKELRDFISQKLSDSYRTKTATNGKLGIEAALSEIPDIIISDVMMPQVDGITLCKTLKAHKKTAHVPIILLTAKSGEDDELKGLGTGADDYITKPFNLQKLKLVIAQRIKLRRLLLDRYQKETLFTLNAKHLTSAEQEFVSKMRKILELKLTDPKFKIQQFSEDMGMSRVQLNRKMKEILNETPTNFLRNERLVLAKLLLQDRKQSISEIAYNSGFSSPSYFIKCFKEKYNKTPLEYLQNRGQ